MLLICIYKRGVAVLELDSHPDHNKGPDHKPNACPKNHPIDHRIKPRKPIKDICIMYNRQTKIHT